MKQGYRIQSCSICGKQGCNSLKHTSKEEKNFKNMFKEVFEIIFKNCSLIIDGGDEKLYASNWQFRLSYDTKNRFYFLQVCNHMNFKIAERDKYECWISSIENKKDIAEMLSDFKNRCGIH